MESEQGAARRRDGSAWGRGALPLLGLLLVAGGAWLVWAGSEPVPVEFTMAVGDTFPRAVVEPREVTPVTALGLALAVLGVVVLGVVVGRALARPRPAGGPAASPSTAQDVVPSGVPTAARPVRAVATAVLVGAVLAGTGGWLAWTASEPLTSTTAAVLTLDGAVPALPGPDDWATTSSGSLLTFGVLVGVGLVALGLALVAGAAAWAATERTPAGRPRPVAPAAPAAGSEPATAGDRAGARAEAHAGGQTAVRAGGHGGGRGAIATAVAGGALVAGGTALAWYGSRPRELAWFAYAPLAEGTSTGALWPAPAYVLGLVLVAIGIILLAGLGGWILARRRG
ncbi:hypothetical protein KIN34_05405 [Cellulomonas sp. DKR-3]|uniref:Uncharacterized protein n=1 Tax=Cellulomonas fulva TaxID=2835530 RepID=A0ABS5TX42_9CELL|nr:hypothetical protein [Cellulomonas fulva]MBT0993720.1 hypothetical protein [Cellulomonas fulva]